MIECPICKVTNNEKAQFCVECGQRLKQTPSASIDSNSHETRDELTKPTQDRRPSIRLHSPILDGKGSYEGEQETSRGGGLRSPLLRGGAHSNNNYEPQSFFPHRSEEENKKPLSHNSELPAQPQKLKSPLLGAAGSEESTAKSSEAKAQDMRGKNESHRGRLHSPVLQGTSNFSAEHQEVYEEEEVEENTNVLRSPLLSAKLPLAEKQASHPQNTQAQIEDKAPSKPNVEQVGEVKPQAAPTLKEHLTNHSIPESPPPLIKESSGAKAELLTSESSPKESGLLQIEIPQVPHGSVPGNNSYPQDETKSFSWTQELPSGTPGSVIDEKKAVQIEAQFRQNLDPKDITPVRVPALDKAPVKPAPSSSPELQDLRLLRSGTVHQAKTLPRRFNETANTTETSQSFTSISAGENTKGKFVTVALSIAIVCKLWYLAAYGPQAWSSLPFLFDQFGQIAVMVCLIIVVSNLSSGKKSL